MNSDAFNDTRNSDRLLAEARQMQAEVVAAFIKRAVTRIAAALEPVMAPLRQWRQRSALDMELRSMSDYELQDIGLVRSDISQVANGTYRDERRGKVARQPNLVRLAPGVRRVPTEVVKVDPKKAA